MARLTLTEAEAIAKRSRPWTIRLECHDPATNTHKFWYATGRGLNEAVESGWGRVGATPQMKLISWGVLQVKVAEKLGRGYDWANTPFVRMDAKHLAMLGGHRPAGQAPVAPVAPSPPAPTQVVVAPTPAPVTSGFNPPPMGIPLSGLPPLDGPYAFIRALYPTKDGFEALDSNGDLVIELTLTGGQELYSDYGIPIVLTK